MDRMVKTEAGQATQDIERAVSVGTPATTYAWRSSPGSNASTTAAVGNVAWAGSPD
jgi:hypothetical protein